MSTNGQTDDPISNSQTDDPLSISSTDYFTCSISSTDFSTNAIANHACSIVSPHASANPLGTVLPYDWTALAPWHPLQNSLGWCR